MGYRNNIEPPKPEDMLPRFSVRNGATLRLAFHCYYLNWEEGHDPHYHDYINWPTRNYHGEACQMLPPRDHPPYGPEMNYLVDDVTPINLTSEGYSQIKVAFDNDDIDDYLTATAEIITNEEGNVVKLHIATAIPTFSGEPKSTKFTVFAVNSTTSCVDEIIHGILDVLPGAIPAS